MKGEKVRELFRKTSVKTCSVILATALVFGSSYWADHQTAVPELVTFVDMDGTIQIAEDEVPLGVPKVSKSTKTKKKTKKIRMKKASKKTYSKKGKTTTKTSTKKSSTSAATTTTETKAQTSVLNKYKKGSKINTQVTTIKTVVTKTVTSNAAGAPAEVQTQAAESAGTLGSKADSRVMNAFNTLGFKFNVNAGVAYSGLFDARTRTITMKKADDTVYHELGHFVAFIAGNADMSPQFQQVFAKEKSKYTAFNKAYVLSSSSEYFAESFKNYTLNPGELSSSRPETYAAIQSALSTITSAQVSRVASVYGAIWK